MKLKLKKGEKFFWRLSGEFGREVKGANITDAARPDRRDTVFETHDEPRRFRRVQDRQRMIPKRHREIGAFKDPLMSAMDTVKEPYGNDRHRREMKSKK